jgi:erythromycin esterase-like protein
MERQLIDAIRETAHLLGGAKRDHDPLLRMARDARVVLLGEPTHGTHDVYRQRARITQRLIAELGFTGVVWEADWPDAERAGRWAQGLDDDPDAAEALEGFERFPTWMWRNSVVLDFLGWLREWNEHVPDGAPRCGVYGMDLYSLYRSLQAVIRYLDQVDPPAALQARTRYSCFDHLGGDPQAYGYAARLGLTPECERAAVEQLEQLRQRAMRGGEDAFSAEQNARLARNAEQYYRSLFGSRISSWNLRDRHMAETLEELLEFLEKRDGSARLVVWAHNSHLGDARATEMGEEGELNVGQLVRERFGREALLVGFTTYDGTVTAAHEWGTPAERMRVVPALPGSIEALFHEVALPRFLLPLRNPGEVLGGLREPRLERAIGVVYRPVTERVSHYLQARLAEQFDAVIHLDHTRAVEPLERSARWHDVEPPETYPSAL